jgi:hypothetical protein
LKSAPTHSIAKFYYSNNIKEDEMGGAYNEYERDEKVVTNTVVGKPERK